jgi:hypothetical protein
MVARSHRFSIALVLFVLMVAVHGVVLAREVTFRAQELGGPGGKGEIWLPSSVIIDQKADLGEPLYFVLQNPTPTDHEFAVGGLFMILSEEVMSALRPDAFTGALPPAQVLAPIRVTIKAGGTNKIQVAPIGLVGPRNLGARYPYFCPTHKDIQVGGFIFVD